MTNIYDFGSQLSAIGDTIQQNRETNRQRELLDKIGTIKDASGNLDYGLAAEAALRAGDMKLATALSSINNQRLERALAERKFAVEPYAPHPTIPGAVVARQGGSADPSVIAAQHEAKVEPPKLTVTDINTLGKEAEKFANLGGFVKDFKPEYAGYSIPGTGSLATWAGRTLSDPILGALGQQGTREAATWWQGYDRFKNVVRNELFGSALTPGESKAFAAADIDPSMNPEQIRTNLARQHQLSQIGLQRKAAALIEAGYRPEAIARVYGVPLAELGIAVQPQRQPGAQQQPRVQTQTPPPVAAPQAPPPPQQPPPVDPRSLPPPLSGAAPPQPTTTAAPAPGSFQDRFSGVSAPREPAPPAAAAAAPGELARPRTPAEAAALPPGTRFIDPNGKVRTRP